MTTHNKQSVVHSRRHCPCDELVPNWELETLWLQRLCAEHPEWRLARLKQRARIEALKGRQP